MTSKGNVLVVAELDNNPHETVDRAIWIAKLLGCGLDIVLCDPIDGALFGSFAISNEAEILRQYIRQFHKKINEEFVDRARNAGLSVSSSVLEQRPIGDGILAKAMDSDPTVVVKGTRYHSIADRGNLVDTDWQLMRTCVYPLWFVKSESIRENPVVVAAVDPTHAHDKPAWLDQIIVGTAKAIAEPLEGELHLIHTYERMTDIGSVANRTFKPVKLPIDEIDKRIRAEHRQALDELAAKTGISEDHTYQMPGRPCEILPTFVRSKKADLVVMGALARWGIKRMVIGSTAERVLDHLPCDVLIVRPNDNQICKMKAR
jgi:universal stress protein E